jgi:LysM repeat protein
MYCLTDDFVACDRYQAWQRATQPGQKARTRRSNGSAPTLLANADSVDDGTATPVIHVFRTGDSLVRIAATYGLTIEQIVATNHLDPNVAVTDGARLVIPIDRPPGGLSRGKEDGPKAGR